MSDERLDDEILGRALARAIETIELNETPFERSRLVMDETRPPRFRLLRLASVASTIAAVFAIGTWVIISRAPTEPSVAATPNVSVSPSSVARTSVPRATTGATAVDHQVIYFARTDLPPIGIHATGIAPQSTPQERIRSRLSILSRNADLSAFAGADRVPPNAFNALRAGAVQGVASVTITGDIATIDFTVPSDEWGVGSQARSFAALQQLVYTASEEPGIRRVLMTQNGGRPVRIDQLVVNTPLSREDVFAYTAHLAIGKTAGIFFSGDDSLAHVRAELVSTVVETGSRVNLTVAGRGPSGEKLALPSYAVWLEQSDDMTSTGAKYALNLLLEWNGGGSSGAATNTTIFDQTPLRSITAIGANVYRVELDDARPWRAYMPDKTQLVLEIGGNPQAVTDRIALHQPTPGADSTHDLRIMGVARNFEGTISWRLRDTSDRAIANGDLNATIGTSAPWATFDAPTQLPKNVVGTVILELYARSARDGSEQGLLRVRLNLSAN